MTKLCLAPGFARRFDLIEIDGWLDDMYLDDQVGENAWIEIASDGSGAFRIGDVRGVLTATSYTDDSIRWQWFATWFDEGLAGTGSVSFLPEQGQLFGLLRCRGEEQPWGFSAKRRGAPKLPVN